MLTQEDLDKAVAAAKQDSRLEAATDAAGIVNEYIMRTTDLVTRDLLANIWKDILVRLAKERP
jgi:hypothetical protein